MTCKINTKEKIVMEALTLFARKGYKGTSVKDIADAVGIKDSSLYKHFKSKQEILDTIMSEIGKHIDMTSESFGLPVGTDYEKAVSYYATFDCEQLVELSKKIFLFYLKDAMISKFWQMGSIEQFQNEKVYALFREFFFEESIAYQKDLFAQMVKHGYFIEADPETMAVSFYSPIFFLLSKYAGSVGKEEESCLILEKQVRAFYKMYRKNG